MIVYLLYVSFFSFYGLPIFTSLPFQTHRLFSLITPLFIILRLFIRFRLQIWSFYVFSLRHILTRAFTQWRLWCSILASLVYCFLCLYWLPLFPNFSKNSCPFHPCSHALYLHVSTVKYHPSNALGNWSYKFEIADHGSFFCLAHLLSFSTLLWQYSIILMAAHHYYDIPT